MKRLSFLLLVTIFLSSFSFGQTYNFDSSIAIEVGNKKDQPVQFQYYFSKANQEVSCMKLDPTQFPETQGMQGVMYMVFSKEESTMLLNMGGMKMRQVVPNTMMKEFDNSKYTERIPNFKKTGKTKAIQGYSCEEYVGTDNDTTVHIWTTKSFPLSASWIPILGMHMGKSHFPGFVLEMNFESKEGNGYIKVVNVNKSDTLTLNSEEYMSMMGR